METGTVTKLAAVTRGLVLGENDEGAVGAAEAVALGVGDGDGDGAADPPPADPVDAVPEAAGGA
jgi:hypothetical protein